MGLDYNKDGKVNLKDLKDWAHKKLDFNDDGKVNFQDVFDLAKSKVDVNNDGKVDAYELKLVIDALIDVIA